MKYLLFFFSLTLSICISISGVAQNFEGGFKAGLVASEVSGDNLSAPNKMGIYAGVFTSRKVADFSHLQLELLYINKGSKGDVSIDEQPEIYKFSLDYTEIALFFVHGLYQYSTQSYVQKMSAEIGLSLGYLVNSYEEKGGLELEFFDRPFNRFEGSIWLGMYFPVTDNTKFNFKFSNSLTPIRKHASGQVVWYNWGQYHTLWKFGLQYTF